MATCTKEKAFLGVSHYVNITGEMELRTTKRCIGQFYRPKSMQVKTRPLRQLAHWSNHPEIITAAHSRCSASGVLERQTVWTPQWTSCIRVFRALSLFGLAADQRVLGQDIDPPPSPNKHSWHPLHSTPLKIKTEFFPLTILKRPISRLFHHFKQVHWVWAFMKEHTSKV